MSVGSYQRGNSNNSSSNSNSNNNNSYISNGCDGTTTSSVRLAGDNTKDRMYEPKHHQKAVRVLTVIAYIFFVSLAAITLSLYYLFIYNPRPPQHANQTNQMFSGGTSAGSSYNGPIGINITDCKQVVAVMNRTMPTPALETPKAMPVINGGDVERAFEEQATTEMNTVFEKFRTKNNNKTSSDGYNSTKYENSGYYNGNDNNIDYYTK